jgi:peptidoglycan/LPS O-acetylase OafA/YrhL
VLAPADSTNGSAGLIQELETADAPAGGALPSTIERVGTSRSQRGHVPALDGVRGVAILFVVTYHAARNLQYVGRWEERVERVINSGWVGVDLFFVLSGFLITSILLEAKRGRRFFRSFYARRVLRIVPLYLTLVVLAVAIAPAWGLATPEQAARLHAVQGWYWTHSVNVLIARAGWSGTGWHTGHLWSLSVEEQFYLVWPVIVFISTRRTLARLCVAIMVTAAVLRLWLVSTFGPSTAVYVLLPTRMDALTTGALMATFFEEPTEWAQARRAALPVAAITIAVLGLIFFQESSVHPSGRLMQMAGYPALSLLGAAAVVSAVSAPSASVQGWLWNLSPLRFLGRYSYGLYGWHPFVIAFLRHRVVAPSAFPTIAGSHLPANALATVVALALSIAVALLSWFLVERPFLALKRFVPYG